MAEADAGTTHADERLSIDQIAAGGLLAATHVQRYALAAELADGRRVLDLCCGAGYGAARLAEVATSVVGVDVSEDAIAQARELTGDRPQADFVVADAAEYLADVTAHDVDLVVCFEGIEHVPDPDAVADQLGRLAAEGVVVVVSVPNSVGFDEDNEFHATDFDFASAQALAARIGKDPVRLDQTHGDAAVLLPATDGGLPETATAVFDTDRAPDPAVVTHWLFGVNVEPELLQRVLLRIAVVSRPHHYGYMLGLERANRELWNTNQRFSRAWVGVYDAAAGRAARMREELQELKKERDSLIERLESAVESARMNDEFFQAARLQLLDREQENRVLRQSLVRRGARFVYYRVRGRSGR